MVAPNGKISTFAGTGTPGYAGDNGAATSAQLSSPMSLAVDASGNLYIGDSGNNTVRRVASNGTIVTAAGNGASVASSGGDGGPATSAPLGSVLGIAVDASGNLYIATGDNRVRIVSPAGVIGTAIGKSETSAYGLLTPVNGAAAVASDSAGNVYFTDTWNNRIRKVSPDGTVVTVAGTGVNGAAGDSGPAVGAQLGNVFGVALDAAGDIYIVDTGNSTIRKVDTNGVITTVAGNGTAGFSGDNGPATSAQLNLPYGVALDAAGNLYIADRYNYRVRKVDTSGVITTVAGNGTQGNSGDSGLATSAEFGVITGLAISSNGGIYVADRGAHRVRRIGSNGIITPLAGTGTSGYSGDGGPATSAKLSRPSGLALDSSGHLFIGDGTVVRVVSPQGTINTVAGKGPAGDSGDSGPATDAKFQYVYGLSVDAVGRVYVADVTSNAVRLLTPVGTQPVLFLDGLPSSLTDGQSGSLALTISNAAQAASTSGLVTITPMAPTGESLTSMSGSGWTCGTSTCTRSDSLSAGASFPAITINLGVAATAKSQSVLAALVSGGGSNATGAEGMVGVLPAAPALTLPAAAATGVALTTPLSWTASGATDSSDVYFGTSNPPPLAGSTAGLTYNPGTLASNQTYYWQVVARNLAGSATSAIWSFTTLSISLTPQTITFGSLGNVTLGVAPFTVGATASSSLAVTFASTTQSVCTVSGATVTVLAAGSCSLTATQAGNATYAAATPVAQSFTVYPLPGLSISKTHTGNFTQGQTGAAYTIVVANGAAGGPTAGAVTVTDGPTSGLTLVSMSGTGWTCDANVAAGCTRSDALAPGASYPPITVLVNVAANATSPQINQGILAGGGLLNPIVTGNMAVIASSTTTLSAASASAGPGAKFSIPITLAMAGGVSADAATFGLQIVPNASAPDLAGSLTFTRNAAITDVPLVNVNGTSNKIAVVWSSLTTPITGSVQLGVVTGTLPSIASTGQTYSVQITGTGVTDGSGNALAVVTGANATLNVAFTYLIGDVAPYTSDTAPSFGDGALNILDLIQVLFAVNNIPHFRPAACSDRFDAMDLYPADTASARGGDGVLDIRDLILELFRVNNLDLARPVRASMGGALPWAACSSGSGGNSAATAALSRNAATAPRIQAPAMGTLALGRPEPYGAATERMPVYLEAARALSRVAVTFGLGDRQSQLSFTPSPDTPPSLASDSQLGVVAAAWLNGVTVPAQGRLLLGYVTGPAGALSNLNVYGVSASALDDNNEVPLAHD